MQIGRYKIKLKPLTYIIVIATAIGVIGGPIILYVTLSRANALPGYGYVRPTQWKFEARGKAVAEATFGPKTMGGQTTTNGRSVFLGDIQQGASVHIKTIDKTPDCIYLRNAMNLTLVHSDKDLELSFEGSAPEPRPVIVAIRDSSIPLWHQKFELQPNNQTFHAAIPVASLRKAKTNNLIVAIHLGFKEGDLFLKNFMIRDK